MASLVAPPRPPVSELEIMFPDRHVTVCGGSVLVREARMLEWVRDCFPVAQPIISRLNHLSSDHDLVCTIPDEPDAWRKLCQKLSAWSCVQDDELFELAVAVAAVNSHLLIPAPPKQHDRRAKLSDMYSKLAANGFGTPADVMERYTERQIVMYYESSMRVERFDRAMHILDINRATNGGKDADKYIKELTSGR